MHKFPYLSDYNPTPLWESHLYHSMVIARLLLQIACPVSKRWSEVAVLRNGSPKQPTLGFSSDDCCMTEHICVSHKILSRATKGKVTPNQKN